MPDSEEMHMDRWRVVIQRGRSEVLVQAVPPALALPEVRVPRNQRLAWHINDQLRRSWGLDAVSLFPLDVAAGTAEAGAVRYHVAELLRPDRGLPDGIGWADASSLDRETFAEPGDFDAVSAYVRAESESPMGSGPFGHAGWLREVVAWLQKTIAPFGLEWRGGFEQFHASRSFSLIRFDTTPRASWFKSVGEPNTREFPITCELAKRIPEHLPRILASRSEWSAWLAEDCPGRTLDQVTDPALWRRAVRHLAELQSESLAWTNSLLPLGAFDLRMLLTPSAVEHFFELARRIAEVAAEREAGGLSIQEFPAMQARMVGLLDQLSRLELPAALGHLDFNGGNVIVSPERTVFLDWAEACVGPPFFALEYLLQTFRRSFGRSSAHEGPVIEAYLAPWESVIPLPNVRELWRITPALAVFAYAQRCVLAAEPFGFGSSRFSSYLWALLRRLKRELPPGTRMCATA
jgi:hypothetical protein